jgi:hypothetical protein
LEKKPLDIGPNIGSARLLRSPASLQQIARRLNRQPIKHRETRESSRRPRCRALMEYSGKKGARGCARSEAELGQAVDTLGQVGVQIEVVVFFAQAGQLLRNLQPQADRATLHEFLIETVPRPASPPGSGHRTTLPAHRRAIRRPTVRLNKQEAPKYLDS